MCDGSVIYNTLSLNQIASCFFELGDSADSELKTHLSVEGLCRRARSVWLHAGVVLNFGQFSQLRDKGLWLLVIVRVLLNLLT